MINYKSNDVCNDGLQQWRFVATLEMAHRARCGDGEPQSKQGDEVGDDIGHRVCSMTCWEQ
jgi:hypothetical protein